MKSKISFVTASGILFLAGFGCSTTLACEPSLAVLPSPSVLVSVPATHIRVNASKSGAKRTRFNGQFWAPDTSGPPPAAVGKLEPFMNNLQNKLKSAWHPPANVHFLPAKFEFEVSRFGKISKIKRLKSSGNAVADDAALLALRRGSPVSSLPPGAPSHLVVQFTFESSTGSTCCCGGRVCSCAKPNSCGRE